MVVPPPGWMANQGISQIVTNPDGNGFAVGVPTLLLAFGLGLGLAAGVSLGTYFASLLVAKSQGVRPRPAAGATLPADPDPDASGSTAPVLSETSDLSSATSRRSTRRQREQAHGIRPWAYAARSGRLGAARPSGAG